ncbi:MAG: sigma-70 family RNA polymerase sigma factor [Acidobacteriota bacterium]
MRDVTVSDIDQLTAADAANVGFEMDEEAFRGFYDRTARALWAYLSRISGDPHLADDLLQETYFRFLRARVPHDGEAHRRNYLFRIATNLVRDAHRRRLTTPQSVAAHEDYADIPSESHDAARTEQRTDLLRAMARLKPRERELLWLAYAQGSSHREISATLGVKCASVKQLLFRARRKMAGLLRPAAKGARREDA